MSAKELRDSPSEFTLLLFVVQALGKNVLGETRLLL